METQLRGDQVYERRHPLQFDAGEISVARKIALLQMTPDAQPIVRRLQRQMNMLGRFQLENRQAAFARNRKHVEDAMLAAAIGEDLRVDKMRIERGVDARYLFANQGLEPPFRLRAIERIAGVARQWMPVRLQIVQQTLQRGARRDP